MIGLTEDSQPLVIYRQGNSFMMKPGYRGICETIGTMRKIFVIVG